MTELLAHAGSDAITYAVSAVVFAAAAWVGIDALRRRKAERERDGAEPGTSGNGAGPGPDAG